MPPIDDFRGEYRWLSNFHLVKVELDGALYSSTENAYQAAKTLDLDMRRVFRVCTPSESKRHGKALTLRPDWESVKVSVMLGLLRQKFQHPELKQKLLATGDIELIEGNWWNDTFWGVCRGVGQNWLGRLLMQVRSELQSAQQ